MDSEALSSLVYTWAPILMMIGFWVFFLRRLGTWRGRGYMDLQLEFMTRQEQLLERIATALERRNARGE
jgi:hypothetical protein